MTVLLCALYIFNFQYTSNHYLYETKTEYVLKNKGIEAHISKENGQITSLLCKNREFLSEHGKVCIKNQGHYIENILISARKAQQFNNYAEVFLKTEHLDVIIEYRYRIDSVALWWEVTIVSKSKVENEAGIDFSLPIVKSMDHIFYPASYAAIPVDSIEKENIIYRRDIFCPVITAYNRMNDYGISIVAPLEIKKPELMFSVDKSTISVSYTHFRISDDVRFTAAIYIIPHGGDWRPGLDFLLNKYPRYFYPYVENTIVGEGWYAAARPHDNDAHIRDVADQNISWVEFTDYFPFYGLYLPQRNAWDIIIYRENPNLNEWEKDIKKYVTGYDEISHYVNKWHNNDIQFYLYFQSFEAWHQYALEYFSSDIARDKSGNPLPAWKSSNLMNPDPEYDWGKHIIGQIYELITKFPEVDGIFYDRMDYWSYDYEHNDGITMIDGRPAYMLGFASENINDTIFKILHTNNKAIWGNIPTSIEVCKNLDGIMAEVYPRVLNKSQYLALTRPIIFYPYDYEPTQTELKLKLSLLCGAFPSITLGGVQCKELDNKYRDLFKLMKNRTWVLTKNPIITPNEIKSNIYQTPEGDYVAVLVHQNKSQLVPDPFEYNIRVTINVNDADEIKYAFLLSGDWKGINALDFNIHQESIKIKLPCHRTASVIFLSKQCHYDIVRLSSPVLITNKNAELIFRINDLDKAKGEAFQIETPWFKETKNISSSIVKFSTFVPDSVKGETDIKVRYRNHEYVMTNWLLDPISITPKASIFMQSKDGENIPFFVINNLNERAVVNLESDFVKGKGSIDLPHRLILQSNEKKEINASIIAETPGEINLSLSTDDYRIERSFPVGMCLLPEAGDLFFDNFQSDLNKWTIDGGEWTTSNGIALGSGSRHFAYLKNSGWKNYTYQVKIKCNGSNNPAVDWLDFYVYFRLQDKNNFYRFGVHGYGNEVDLYKCIDATWQKIATAFFTPQKNRWYALRIEVRDSRIIGYIDGEKLVEAEDNTFSSGGIGIGVFYNDMRCEYKDVVVKRL